jgi:dihydrofolate reductase
MIISAIAAMAENWVIGRDNTLPWKLQDDLVRFRQTTMNHPIIMGRKTFESIGRILPGRRHLIVSRNVDYKVAGAEVVSSLEQAVKLCEGKTDEAFIIGGAEIYRQSLPWIDRLYLTLIHQQIPGDAHFPPIHFRLSKGNVSSSFPLASSHHEGAQAISDFKTVSQEDHLEGPLPYSFLVLKKGTST